MRVWAIRHKPSGFYLPEPEHSKRGRGGTLYEPSHQDDMLPRLFRKERSAKMALTAWLQGKWRVSYCTWDGDQALTVRPVPSRRREEMEIVEFELVEVQ